MRISWDVVMLFSFVEWTSAFAGAILDQQCVPLKCGESNIKQTSSALHSPPLISPKI